MLLAADIILAVAISAARLADTTLFLVKFTERVLLVASGLSLKRWRFFKFLSHRLRASCLTLTLILIGCLSLLSKLSISP